MNSAVRQSADAGRYEHGVTDYQERVAGCVFKECATGVVQGHKMGCIFECHTVAVRDTVVLGLAGRWRAGWFSSPLRVPLENTGLDTTMGWLE